MSQTTLVCVENSTVGTHRSNQRVFKHGSNIIRKVVNDVQNVIPSKHYIIDSSSETEEDGAEGADQVQRKTAEKLVRAKSSFSSGAGGDSKHEAPNFRTAGSQRERGVHFADDIQVCGSKDNIESPGSLSPPPPASAPSIIHPFFTWNVVSYSTSRVSYSQSHVKVYPLLNQVDKTMARKRQRIHRYLYWRGFECTLQELERRHPYLTSTRSNDVSNHISEMKKDRLDGTRGRPGGAQSKRFYTILEEDHDMDAIRPSLEWQNMVNNNLRPLFDVFKAVAQTFVPADMEVVHRYWKKLWGSMGQILRVGNLIIIWSRVDARNY